jgi:dihydrofolate synthase/folylpolyglutamate synthase
MKLIETYSDAVAYIDHHIGYGIRPGLERITAILELMGNPQHSYPIIHVAGTNGKTSTARIASAILTGHGLRVGLTTSPHLDRVEERLELDNEVAAEWAFAEAVADIQPFVELYRIQSGDQPTYFELTTILALSYFAANAVDVAVVETGLGGRLDATNVVDGKVAVVTGVSLEHTEYLGDTIAEIAREKVAIAKPGSSLVTGDLSPDALAVVHSHAAALRLTHRQYGVDFSPIEPLLAVGGWTAGIRGGYADYDDLFVPLHGRYQVDNLAVAVAATEELFGRPLSDDGLRQGLSEVTVPGRLEVVGHQPLVVIDGAHNPEGIDTLVSTLEAEFGTRSWTVVLGAMEDKDVATMIAQLEPIAARIVTTQVSDERAIDAGRLRELVAGTLDIPVSDQPSPEAAIDTAIGSTLDDGGVLVTGSLYLVGAIRASLRR